MSGLRKRRHSGSKAYESFLTIEDLKLVRTAVFRVRSQWEDIGVELSIPDDTLKTIKHENDRVADCFREMLSTWLRMTNPKPTWSALVEALKQPAVDDPGLADSLRQKYCPSIATKQKKSRRSVANKTSTIAQSTETVSKGHDDYSSWDSMTTRDIISRTLPHIEHVFGGREEELKNLSKLVREQSPTHIISITGSPGFGKSTLAIHLGYLIDKWTGYSVMYTDIAEADSMFYVKQEILNTVELENQVTFDDPIKWVKLLRSSRNITVLILDNCDSILHTHQVEFQELLKAMIEQSKRLKTVLTAKHVTMFLGPFQHFQLKELTNSDAASVLKKIAGNINSKLAKKLVKLVGNVPLALQVIGALLRDPMFDNDQIVAALKQDIISTLSPDELPPAHRVETSLRLSYQYLPKKVQICGRILSNFPTSFTLEVANQILAKMDMPWLTILRPWGEMNTTKCLSMLRQRSLLTYEHTPSGRYRYHSLIKDFFQYQYTLLATNPKYRLLLFLERIMVTLQHRSHYIHVLLDFMSAVRDRDIDKIGLHYEKIHLIYDGYLHENEKIMCKHNILPVMLSDNNITMTCYDIVYMMQFQRKHFFDHLALLYHSIEELDICYELYSETHGYLKHFSRYVKYLVDLSKSEALAYNSTIAVKHLQMKYKRVALYHLNASVRIESNKALIPYYAALATQYRHLNQFENFIDSWKEILFLRSLKCTKHMYKCSDVDLGLAAFGRGNYSKAIKYLKPQLHVLTLPVNKRARLFVIVYECYTQLHRLREASSLLNDDTDLEIIMSTNNELSSLKMSPINVVTILYKFQYYRVYPPKSNGFSITWELLTLLVDDQCKICRTLMIFGAFLKQHKQTYVLGYALQRKVHRHVNIIKHLMGEYVLLFKQYKIF